MKTIVETIKTSSFSKTYTIGVRETTIVLLVTGKKNQQIFVGVNLTKPGGQVNIMGVIVGKNSDHIVLNTLQHHKEKETTSNLLVKSLLKDHATFAYDGAIRVEPKAQKTDAYQRNENLIVSDFAHAESKPKLEILANDVRCTHGATIGSLRDDELWYLASRGIAKNEASLLISQGFLSSTVAKLSDEKTQKMVYSFIESAL